MKKWIFGVLGAIVGSLTVAWITGQFDLKKRAGETFPSVEHAEQRAVAKEAARKYYFFATGNLPWSNPRQMGFQNEFRPMDNVVYDAGTGLTWQKGGSPTSIGYPQITAYLLKLNEDHFGGYGDWRLPSLIEAWTLLESQRTSQGLYIDPVFDSDQTWIWTSNTTGDGYGWFIFIKDGFPMFQNYWQSHAYVRAVRGSTFQ